MTTLLTYVEIDVDYCSLSYGVAPCDAAIPTTGAAKCYNTLKTCQDRANFTNVPKTLRFCVNTEDLPRYIEAIPLVASVDITPAVISLGEDLGQRATVTVTFNDAPDTDAADGFDKYFSERTLNPFVVGTLFGKFRARQPYLSGRPLRVIRGTLGQSLPEMETRHFVIDSFEHSADGRFSVVAKDALKLASGDKAVAPRLSSGFLASGITDIATSATLSPAGIGDVEYPASGYVAIGGKEIVAFTRSGNTLTITRGQLGTTAQAHSAEDRVQICLRYAAQTPAVIIEDLLTTYAGIPSDYIDTAAWDLEVDTYLDRLYTGTVAEPTPVEKLVSELIEQAALALWWDDSAREVRLIVIRQTPAISAVVSESTILEGTLQTQEQPNKRLSTVQTYFGQRNPLEGLDDPSNYRSSIVTVNTEAAAEYGQNAIKTIFSRWIPFGGRSIAGQLNGLQLGRFRDPPRRVSFNLYRYGELTPTPGLRYNLAWWHLQSADGVRTQVPIQLTSVEASDAVFAVEAEEMHFDSTFLDSGSTTARVITIDVSENNINLRSLHDTLFPVPTTGDAATVTVTCIIETGVTVGSNLSTSPALSVGSWPAGWDADNLIVINRGTIQGRGGKGGNGSSADAAAQAGDPGGTALYTRTGITLDNLGSILGGGGGGGGGRGSAIGFGGVNSGGGGGGGGRGAADSVGGVGAPVGGVDGSPGTDAAPGAGGAPGPLAGGSLLGGAGALGGAAGAAGATGGSNNSGNPGATGGAAGNSIDGVSYVTSVTAGTKTGPQIN